MSGNGAVAGRVRVMVVDDHAFVREAIATALTAMDGVELVGAYADGESAILAAAELDPDVIIVDFALSDMTGPDIMDAVRRAGGGARFVLLTGAPLDAAERAALAGVTETFVHKESGIDDLMAAVRVAAASQQTRTAPEESSMRGVLAAGRLTRREQAVMCELAAGRSVVEAARRLGVSPATVRKHRENSMAKLNVNSTAALVRAAIQLGWA